MHDDLTSNKVLSPSLEDEKREESYKKQLRTFSMKHRDDVYKLRKKYKFWNYFTRTSDIILQIIILGGAAVVPYLLTVTTSKLIPTIISSVVAVAAVLANYFRVGERYLDSAMTYRELEREIQNYELRKGVYRTPRGEWQANNLLVDQVNEILDRHFQRMISFEVKSGDGTRNTSQSAHGKHNAENQAANGETEGKL